MKKFSQSSISTIIVSLVIGFIGPVAAFAAGPAPINLGSIDTNNFVILGETGITDVPTSIITGNIGNSAGSGAQIGVTCGEITGSIYTVDALATFAGGPGGSFDNTCVMPGPGANKTLVDNAVSDMGIAYTNASAPATPAGVGPNLNIGAGTVGTMTLAPGVYTWGSNVTITNDVTLSGGANDVWVFQISGTLDLAVGKKIILSGGAQAKNVFWQVAGTVNLLAGSQMQGIILAQTDIAMRAGATLNGRALAQTAVTLISNTISLSNAPVVVTAKGHRPGVVSIIPLIGITKVPSPLALSAGSGKVTYNYNVWNVGGQQALVDVTVVDDKCIPVVYSSGDLNGDKKLDPGENWKYTCSTTLTSTTTNTAIATGHSDDAYYHTAIATAIATVVVGSSIQPPLINLVVVPNQLTPFTFGGGDVTYKYTVINSGTVPIHNVSLTDNKCAAITFISGDNNGNKLLDSNEIWTYTCKTNINVSTDNIATVKGDANGLSAVAFAFANVLVNTPNLPNTGITPEGVTVSWLTVLLSAIILVLVVSLVCEFSKEE